jgi:hypothetical protein
MGFSKEGSQKPKILIEKAHLEKHVAPRKLKTSPTVSRKSEYML